jgi:hypothetical protein
VTAAAASHAAAPLCRGSEHPTQRRVSSALPFRSFRQEPLPGQANNQSCCCLGCAERVSADAWVWKAANSEAHPKAAARLVLEVSAGWANPSSHGLWGGIALLLCDHSVRPTILCLVGLEGARGHRVGCLVWEKEVVPWCS